MADYSEAINALIDAVEAIERELGVTPSAVYQNVRARLDILEARINNPYLPSPDVDNPFFIGNTGVTISVGDGYPATSYAPGSLYLRTDGYNNGSLFSRGADGIWWDVGAGGGGGGGGGGGAPSGPAGGDLAGVYPSPIIANNAVTFSKIQTIATDSLLGRDTTGTGNVENILLNSTLSMDGSGNLQRSALTGDITATAGSNTTNISSNVIVDADVNTAAAIQGTKISPDFGAQIVRSTGQFIGASSGTPTSLSDGGSFESCITSSGNLRGLVNRQSSSDGYGARVILQKSRGTHSSPSAHAANDILGDLVIRSYDGSSFYDALITRAVGVVSGSTNKRVRAESYINDGYNSVKTGNFIRFLPATTTDGYQITIESIVIPADTTTRLNIVWHGQQSSNIAHRETSLTVRRSGSGNIVEISHTDGVSLYRDDSGWGDSTQIAYTLNQVSHAVDITVKGKTSTTVVWTGEVSWTEYS